MRQHCRSQHGYDPEPNVQPFGNTTNLQKTTALPETLENKLMNKIEGELKLLELGLGRPFSDKIRNVRQSTELSLAYILNNFVLVRKRQIQGISGHICNSCMTFDFKYIMDIGGDTTLGEKHRCRVDALEHARNIQNIDSAIIQLHEESVRCLVRLCRSVFGNHMELVSRPISLENLHYTTFYLPRSILHTIDSSHWAWPVIHVGSITIGQEILEKILSDLIGTFAVISIDAGEFRGHYLLKVTRDRAVF